MSGTGSDASHPTPGSAPSPPHRTAMGETSHQRWYDYDPTLLDVLTLLRNFQPEVREQAAVFLTKVEAAVGPEAMAEFSAQIEANPHKGKRWYDADPVLYKAIELLRVLPPDIQRQAATRFLDAMQRLGITHDVVQ